MTLPSCPVSVIWELPPGRSVASMKRTSPPVSVHATPVATPGREVRNETSWWIRGGPRNSGRRGPSTVSVGVSPSSGVRLAPGGNLPRDRANPSLEVADAGLARVLADDSAQRGIRNLEHLDLQAMFAHLTRDEIAPRDVQLLFLAVTRELNDLHSIEQRRVQRA